MIAFHNRGLIDLRSVKTFGISAKDNANPIGYFGTGLKYAIAVCLRKNCEVSMSVGKDIYKFEKKNVTVRGKPFEMITMNGEELPFTTHLGANWELWQAFRELYCNAIDESGEVINTHSMEASENTTIFAVGGAEFADLFFERNTIVLNLPKNLLVNKDDQNIEIYDKPSEYVYYRGIRVLRLDNKAQFTYNIIEKCDLTEDRTLKHDGLVLRKIPVAWAKIADRPTIRRVLLASDFEFESSIDFYNLYFDGALTSMAFEEELNHLFEQNTDSLNPSAIRYIQKKRAKSGHKHYETVELTPVQRKQFDKAKRVCVEVFPGFETYEIMIVKNLGEETMALADMDRQTIILSKAVFERGTKYLMSTMIEEYIHLKTGLGDCTRSLQTYLFDTICTLIENYHLREPL